MAFLDNPFCFGISKIDMFVDDNDLTSHIAKWNSFLDNVFGDDKDITLPNRSCVVHQSELKYADSVFEVIPRGRFKCLKPSKYDGRHEVIPFSKICKRFSEVKVAADDDYSKHLCDVDLRNEFVQEMFRSVKSKRTRVSRYSSIEVSTVRESENIFFPPPVHSDLFEMKCHDMAGRTAEYTSSRQRPPDSSIFILTTRALDKPRVKIDAIRTRTESFACVGDGDPKKYKGTGYDIDCRNRFFVLSDDYSYPPLAE